MNLFTKFTIVTYASLCLSLTITGLQANFNPYTWGTTIARSKTASSILYMVMVQLAVTTSSVGSRLLLGLDRQPEVAEARESLASFLLDSLLALTVFRDPNLSRFFGEMMATVCARWWTSRIRLRTGMLAAQGDVGSLELARLGTAVLGVAVASCYLASSSAAALYAEGPSLHLLFALEAVLMFAHCAVTALSLALFTATHLLATSAPVASEAIQRRSSSIMLHAEFFHDFVALLLYLAFFCAVFSFYGIPLHLLRQLYIAFTRFSQRTATLLAYRRATANLATRFPVVSPPHPDICSICREELTTAASLPCGHYLHQACLRSWLERRQVCPVCMGSLFKDTEGEGDATAPGAARNERPPAQPPRDRVRVRVGAVRPHVRDQGDDDREPVQRREGQQQQQQHRPSRSNAASKRAAAAAWTTTRTSGVPGRKRMTRSSMLQRIGRLQQSLTDAQVALAEMANQLLTEDEEGRPEEEEEEEEEKDFHGQGVATKDVGGRMSRSHGLREVAMAETEVEELMRIALEQSAKEAERARATTAATPTTVAATAVVPRAVEEDEVQGSRDEPTAESSVNDDSLESSESVSGDSDDDAALAEALSMSLGLRRRADTQHDSPAE